MPRTRSRAKKLQPRICEICQETFQPYTCRQKICGKKECEREYEIIKAREAYYRNKEKEQERKGVLDPEIRRNFSVEYTRESDKWYWKAVADNGSVLENGPFQSRQEAKKDFLEATQ